MKSVAIDSQLHYIPEDAGHFFRMHKCSENCPCEPELVIDKDDPEDEKEIWYHKHIM